MKETSYDKLRNAILSTKERKTQKDWSKFTGVNRDSVRRYFQIFTEHREFCIFRDEAAEAKIEDIRNRIVAIGRKISVSEYASQIGYKNEEIYWAVKNWDRRHEFIEKNFLDLASIANQMIGSSEKRTQKDWSNILGVSHQTIKDICKRYDVSVAILSARTPASPTESVSEADYFAMVDSVITECIEICESFEEFKTLFYNENVYARKHKLPLSSMAKSKFKRAKKIGTSYWFIKMEEVGGFRTSSEWAKLFNVEHYIICNLMHLEGAEKYIKRVKKKRQPKNFSKRILDEMLAFKCSKTLDDWQKCLKFTKSQISSAVSVMSKKHNKPYRYLIITVKEENEHNCIKQINEVWGNNPYGSIAEVANKIKVGHNIIIRVIEELPELLPPKFVLQDENEINKQNIVKTITNSNQAKSQKDWAIQFGKSEPEMYRFLVRNHIKDHFNVLDNRGKNKKKAKEPKAKEPKAKEPKPRSTYFCGLSSDEVVTKTINLIKNDRKIETSEVCRCIGISIRTFQRRLQQAGTTFKELVNSSIE
jgi:AraC-like DNA-binding protein